MKPTLSKLNYLLLSKFNLKWYITINLYIWLIPVNNLAPYDGAFLAERAV